MSPSPGLAPADLFPFIPKSSGGRGLDAHSQPRPVEGPLCESILRPALEPLATLALGTGDQNSISCLSCLPKVWNSTSFYREGAAHCVL